MKKRLLAILLTICMVAALLPTAAFATDVDVSATAEGIPEPTACTDNYVAIAEEEETTAVMAAVLEEATSESEVVAVMMAASDGTISVYINGATTASECASLSDAITTATTAEGVTDPVVKLGENVTLSESLTIAENTTITIDLNGKNITCSNSYAIVNKGTLTIQDTSENASTAPGTIEVSGESAVNNTGSIEVKSGKIFSDIGSGIYSTDTVTISGGTVEGWRGVYAYSGANVYIEGGEVIGRTYYSNSVGVLNNGGTANVSGGTVSGPSYGIWSYGANATVTVSGTAEVKGSTGILNGASDLSDKTHKVTVTGGTVTGTSYYGISNIYGGVTDVSGGAVSGNTDGVRCYGGNTKVTVSGGTVSGSTNGILCYGGNTEVTVSGGTVSGTSRGIWNYGANSKVTVSSNGEVKGTNSNGILNGATTTKKIDGISIPTPVATGTVTITGGSVSGVEAVCALGSSATVAVSGGTVTGTGTSSGVVVKVGASGTISGNAEITGYYGVYTQGYSDYKTYSIAYDKEETTPSTSLTVSGGTITAETFALCGNGSWDHANITISNGTITSTGANAIYFPQVGDLTIEGGTIEGAAGGVQYCGAGTVTISGGTLKSTYKYTEFPNKAKEQGDGSSADGAALSIQSRGGGYQGEGDSMTVTISGGNFVSTNNSAIEVYRFEKLSDGWVINDKTSVSNYLNSLSISGGTFSSGIKKDDLNIDTAAEKVVFITGGYFTTDPGDYVATNYIVDTSRDNDDYVYQVREKKAEDTTIVRPAVTDPVASTGEKISAENKAAAENVAKSVEIPALAEEAKNADADVTDAKAQLEKELGTKVDGDVTVFQKTYVETTTTEYTIKGEDSVVSMDITPKLDVVVATTNKLSEVNTTGTSGAKNAAVLESKTLTITDPVEITVTLPKDTFKNQNVYVEHNSSSGTYYYTSKADENGELTFTSEHGFSPFSFSLKNRAAAWYGEIGYSTLQEAVDTAVDKGTIDVSNKNSDTIYVGSTKTFTLTNASNFTGKVVASNIYTTVTANDNKNGSVTYTCVYTAPSVPVYRVVVNDAEGGKIKASANKAAEGATIVLTPIADDEESELETLAVVDEDGNTITLTKRANGTYSFVMPAKAVTVTGTFTIVADPEEPDEDEEPGDEEEEATVFTDVDEDAYYAEAVAWAVANEITKGTSETTFSPDDDCTRAQVVTFLWRYAGKPEPTTTENPFTDVEEGTDYYKAILWAYENGITTGTSETTFSPDETCTRAQVVTFLWRYEGELTYEEAETFTDVAEDAYYAKAVAWAVHEWITNGTGDGQFSPDETCTRGQVVTFLYRDTAEG